LTGKYEPFHSKEGYRSLYFKADRHHVTVSAEGLSFGHRLTLAAIVVCLVLLALPYVPAVPELFSWAGKALQ